MKNNILILDDDQAILDMFTELLIDEGYTVHAFKHIDNVFELIETVQPTTILIDFLLGGLNGGELCAQIKKSPETSSIPVVIMSGYEKVLRSLGDYHCDAFFAKPLDVDGLLTYLKQNN